jgi:23S rRNA (guanosine2251-2'-O)-methyltransferase
VEEAFAAGRPAIRLLVVPQRREPLEKLVLHATRLRIPIVELEGGSLTSLAGFDGHQGVALVVEPRVFASLDDVLGRSAERGEPPFVLVLDSLEDPQNVGTLLRSAEAAGVHGVLFPTRRQAPLTPAAVKASAGAVEHLLLCPVDDLAGALADLHGHGLRVAGSEAEAPLTARQSDLRGPLALVVGSEGQGLGPTVRKRCDLLMRIPMRGAVGSLNAAVAGSILLFEAVAQRDPEGVARRAAVAPWPGPRTGVTGAAMQTDDASAAEESDAVDEGRPGEASATNGETATSVSPTVAAPALDTEPPGEDLLPAVPPPAAKPKRTRVAKAPAVDTTPAVDTAPAVDIAPAVDTAPAGEDLLPAEPPPAAKPKRTRAVKAPKD